MKSIALNELTCDLFKKHLGSRFMIRLNDRLVEFDLVEATDLGTENTPSDLRSPFSLLFEAGEISKDLPLSQGTYEIQHAELGAMELFLTPVLSTGNGPQFEAVFN